MKPLLWMFMLVFTEAFQFNDVWDDESCDPLAFIRAEIGARSDDPDIRYKSIVDGYVALAEAPILDIIKDSEKDPLQMFIDNMNPNEAAEHFEEYCEKKTFQKILPLLQYTDFKLQKGILHVVFYTSRTPEQVNTLLECNILDYLNQLLKDKAHTSQIFQILHNLLKFQQMKSDQIVNSQIIRNILPFFDADEKEIIAEAFDVASDVAVFYPLEDRCGMYFKIIPTLYKHLYKNDMDFKSVLKMLHFLSVISINDIESATPWECKMLFENYHEERIMNAFVQFLGIYDEKISFNFFVVLTNLFKITEKPLQKLNDYNMMKLIYDILHRDDEDSILVALNFLKYLSVREKSVVASAEILGSITSLINKPNVNIRMQTLNYIASMGKFTSNHVPFLMEQNILIHLKQFFDGSQTEVSMALRIIAHIVDRKEYLSNVIEHGYFPKIVESLSHENEKIQEIAFWSIGRIFLHRDINASLELVDRGVILPFCNQIQNKGQQEIILKGLYNLVQTDKKHKDKLCEELQNSQCLEKLEKLEKDEEEMVKLTSLLIVSKCQGDLDDIIADKDESNNEDDTKDSIKEEL